MGNIGLMYFRMAMVTLLIITLMIWFFVAKERMQPVGDTTDGREETTKGSEKKKDTVNSGIILPGDNESDTGSNTDYAGWIPERSKTEAALIMIRGSTLLPGFLTGGIHPQNPWYPSPPSGGCRVL